MPLPKRSRKFLQRRRERFLKGVFVAVAGTTVLLAVLLILGCNSEHARAASAMAVAAAVSTAASDTSVTDFETGPRIASTQTSPPPTPFGAPPAVPVVSKAGETAPAGQPAIIYVVKPADTLSGIAKAHGTTVQAVKLANGLDTDRIGIGMKLKMPEA